MNQPDRTAAICVRLRPQERRLLELAAELRAERLSTLVRRAVVTAARETIEGEKPVVTG